MKRKRKAKKKTRDFGERLIFVNFVNSAKFMKISLYQRFFKHSLIDGGPKFTKIAFTNQDKLRFMKVCGLIVQHLALMLPSAHKHTTNFRPTDLIIVCGAPWPTAWRGQ